MVSDDDGRGRDDGAVSFSWPLSYKGDRPRPRLPGGETRGLVFWIWTSPLSALSPGLPAPEKCTNYRDGNVLTHHLSYQHSCIYSTNRNAIYNMFYMWPLWDIQRVQIIIAPRNI